MRPPSKTRPLQRPNELTGAYWRNPEKVETQVERGLVEVMHEGGRLTVRAQTSNYALKLNAKDGVVQVLVRQGPSGEWLPGHRCSSEQVHRVDLVADLVQVDEAHGLEVLFDGWTEDSLSSEKSIPTRAA